MAHFAAFRTASIKLRSVFNLSPQSSNSSQQQEHNRFSEGVERWARPSASAVLTSSSTSVSSTSDTPDTHCKEDNDKAVFEDSHQGLRSKSVDNAVSGAPVYADPTSYTDSDELPTLANSTIDRCNRILQQSMDRWERAAVVHSGSPIDAGDDLYETSQTYTRRQIAVPKRSPIRRAAATTTASAASPSTTENKGSMAATTQSAISTEDSHASSQTASSPSRRELSSSFMTGAPSSGYTATNFTTSTNFAKTIAIDITKASSPSTNVAYTAVTAPEVPQEGDLQTEEDTTAPRESDAMSATEQYEKVASKKKKSAKDNKQKDMNVISDRVRRELIAPEKPVTAKIVKFSKNGFPVVRFTGQFSWIGLRAKVAAESNSSFDDYKVGQNVYVQITNIYQESESDSESYWLVDCKLREEAGVPNPAANNTVSHQHTASHDQSQNASQGGSSTSTRLKFGPTEKKETATKSSVSRAPLDPAASSFVPSNTAVAPVAPSAPQPQMPQQQQQQRFFIGQPYYIAPVYYVPMPQQQAPYPAQYSPSPYDYFASVADQYGLR